MSDTHCELWALDCLRSLIGMPHASEELDTIASGRASGDSVSASGDFDSARDGTTTSRLARLHASKDADARHTKCT